jgi:hypothetical protein
MARRTAAVPSGKPTAVVPAGPPARRTVPAVAVVVTPPSRGRAARPTPPTKTRPTRRQAATALKQGKARF